MSTEYKVEGVAVLLKKMTDGPNLVIAAFLIIGLIMCSRFGDDISDHPQSPESVTEKEDKFSDGLDNLQTSSENVPLKYPVRRRMKIQGKYYAILDFGSMKLMAQDLNVDIHENFYVKRIPRRDAEGYWSTREDKRNQRTIVRSKRIFPAVRYYTRDACEIACRSVGWQLITNSQFTEILYLLAPDLQNIGDQGFDPYRAYASLVKGGDFKFNASLSGYLDLDYIPDFEIRSDAELRLEEYGQRGYYWTSSFSHLNTNAPIVYRFDKNEGLVRYRADKSWAFPCRCVKGN